MRRSVGGDVERHTRGEAQHRERAHDPSGSPAQSPGAHARNRDREAADGDHREHNREHVQHHRSSTTDPPPAQGRYPAAEMRTRRRLLLGAVGSGLLGALLFVPAVGAGRLADDFVLVRTVRHVSGAFWPFTHNDLGQPAGSGAFYRPAWLVWNTVAYDLSHSAAFAHVLNLILFATVCAEVVLLVWRVAGSRPALIAGVLFAVYPSHGESVAWISGNTDLLAIAWGLAAIVLALSVGPSLWRDLGIAALTGLAMLTKEIAAILPALMAIVLWATPAETGAARPRGYWRPAIVMLITIAVVMIPRTIVVGGVGGYGGQPLTLRRAAGSLLSFIVGGLSAPQLQVLQHPVLFLVPLALVVLLAAGSYRARRAGAGTTARLATGGIAWFLVAVIPVLNQPLNLNTRNGDRLLLLPSVGLALASGALIARTGRKTVAAAWVAVAVLCAVSCVRDALDWQAAGVESSRLLGDIERLAPPGAHLVALSVPTDYRAAHLYPDALDFAVQETGRPDITLAVCMPVHVLSLRPRQISFRVLAGDVWVGRATTQAPFDVPVLGSAIAQSGNGCQFAPAPHQPKQTLGTALTALVRPTPPSGQPPPVPIYFDGLDMRRAR